MRMIVILSDLQGHKVDRRAWKNVQLFLKEHQPEEIVLNGDIFDFDALKAYRKNPYGEWPLEKELDWGKKHILAPLAALLVNVSTTKVVYLPGNHEDRAHRYLCDKAPELYGTVMPLPKLLELDDFDIEYHDKEYRINKHLLVTHGHIVRKHSCYTAKQMVDDYMCSVIMGHTHRMGMFYRAGHGGREWVGVENGHLMALKEATYVAGSANWQQGFTVVWDHGGGLFNIEQAKIIRGKVYFGGRVYG